MSKIISLSDDVYNKLKEIKGNNSYSIIIREMLKKRSNKEAILKFAGRGGINEEEILSLKKDWKRWSQKYA